ncbi:MAG: hypothetical protein EBS79_14545 [Gammaproteobacteria bacterium]|nr:hypothetical protein [Gammaproteobacteria bacterium]
MNKIHTIAASLIGTLAVLALGSQLAHAQQAPIERIKLTDNELSCAQLHAEIGVMDKAIAEARTAEGDGSDLAPVYRTP